MSNVSILTKIAANIPTRNVRFWQCRN